MFENRLLEPFRELCELIPDVNDKRAKKSGQWIFTEDPLDWSQKFPRITIKYEDLILLEKPNQEMPAGEKYSISCTFDVKITYYTKRMESYICPDGAMRKGKAFLEYFGINIILPTFMKNKALVCQKYDWLEIINLSPITKEEDVENYGLKKTFTMKVYATFSDYIPTSNDGYINTINLNETVIKQIDIN